MWAIVIGAIFGAGVMTGVLIYLQKPPVVVTGADLSTRVVQRGGDIDLIFSKIENVACETSAVRWLWRYDPTDPQPDDAPTKRKQYRELRSTPDTPPSIGKEGFFRVSIPIPLTIEPGEWNYQGVYRDTCPSLLGGSAPRFSPSFPVRVESEFRDNTKPHE
jgi:hypothetical protein